MILHELDKTDLAILALLQENARLTNKEIAYKTYKSLSSVHERIRKLEEKGFIEKYITILNREFINRNLMCWTYIQIKDHSQEALLHFQQDISQFEEVMECYHTSGAQDFILKIVVRDMAEYNQFVSFKLSTARHIGSVQSFFVINETKHSTAYSLKSVREKQLKK